MFKRIAATTVAATGLITVSLGRMSLSSFENWWGNLIRLSRRYGLGSPPQPRQIAVVSWTWISSKMLQTWTSLRSLELAFLNKIQELSLWAWGIGHDVSLYWHKSLLGPANTLRKSNLNFRTPSLSDSVLYHENFMGLDTLLTIPLLEELTLEALILSGQLLSDVLIEFKKSLRVLNIHYCRQEFPYRSGLDWIDVLSRLKNFEVLQGLSASHIYIMNLNSPASTRLMVFPEFSDFPIIPGRSRELKMRSAWTTARSKMFPVGIEFQGCKIELDEALDIVTIKSELIDPRLNPKDDVWDMVRMKRKQTRVPLMGDEMWEGHRI